MKDVADISKCIVCLAQFLYDHTSNVGGMKCNFMFVLKCYL